MGPTKGSGSRRDSASILPARNSSKPKKERKGKTKEPALSPQEVFEARKEALIQEKRAEGNAITQRHENMVSSRTGVIWRFNKMVSCCAAPRNVSS